MCDIATVNRMLDAVAAYSLCGGTFLETLTASQLAQGFNGIGPEWFPDALRRAIDRLHADFLPVAFVHDEQWAWGPCTKEWFDLTNDMFEENGRIVADAKYGWWDPRRYIRRRQARDFAVLCRYFGWPAFMQAAKERETK